MRRLLSILIILGGLAVAGWLGYMIIENSPQQQQYMAYPMNLQVSGLIPGTQVETAYRVEVDEENGFYNYHYTVTNQGDEPVMFRWELIERLDSQMPNIFYMKKGDVFNYTFKHRDAPVLAPGLVVLYMKTEDGRWVADTNVVVQPGPVPNNLAR